MVFAVCRLNLRDADEAEDAAQQVFLSAYRSLLSGTVPRNPGAWLATIARHEARARAQTRRLRPVGLDTEREAESRTLEEQVDARAQLSELHAGIAALPEKQREAVVLRDFYGLRYDEVARALGTSRPAVEALLFRARRRLQTTLRPGVAAGVLAVPLALRESLAYAVPGFAGGAASSAGLLAKLAAAPVAAKLAAAGMTVGVAGSAGVLAERRVPDPPARPAAPLAGAEVEADGAPAPPAGAARARAAALLPPLPVRRVAADEPEPEPEREETRQEEPDLDDRSGPSHDREERDTGAPAAGREDDDRERSLDADEGEADVDAEDDDLPLETGQDVDDELDAVDED